MVETLCIYATFILGICILEENVFIGYVLAIKNRIRIKRHFEKTEFNVEDMGAIAKKINLLLGATTGQGGKTRIIMFYLISFCTGLLVYILLSYVVPNFVALTTGILLVMAPYGILKIKLQRIRVRSSNEGEILVAELLNNYKINYCNMKEAVEITAMSIENAPNCKRLLLDVAKGFNKAASKDDFEKILGVFRYSLDTSWGNVLADNIYFAQVLGIKVTDSLSDLVKCISEAEKVREYGKREGNEASMILKYLAPICFGLTVIGACKYFGFTISKYFYYQFGTSTGLSWFIAIVIFYAGGMMINEFISKNKMDLWY